MKLIEYSKVEIVGRGIAFSVSPRWRREITRERLWDSTTEEGVDLDKSLRMSIDPKSGNL